MVKRLVLKHTTESGWFISGGDGGFISVRDYAEGMNKIRILSPKSWSLIKERETKMDVVLLGEGDRESVGDGYNGPGYYLMDGEEPFLGPFDTVEEAENYFPE